MGNIITTVSFLTCDIALFFVVSLFFFIRPYIRPLLLSDFQAITRYFVSNSMSFSIAIRPYIRPLKKQSNANIYLYENQRYT